MYQSNVNSILKSSMISKALFVLELDRNQFLKSSSYMKFRFEYSYQISKLFPESFLVWTHKIIWMNFQQNLVSSLLVFARTKANRKTDNIDTIDQKRSNMTIRNATKKLSLNSKYILCIPCYNWLQTNQNKEKASYKRALIYCFFNSETF